MIDVNVDGQSRGAISSYTFSHMTTNHTIDASFAIDTYVLSAAANGNITPAGSINVDHGASHTINATFAADTFAVAATAGTSGRITPAGVSDVIYGGSQTYTFVADEGFHISDVLIDGRSFGALESYTFTDVTEGHTIAVNFSENTPVNIWIPYLVEKTADAVKDKTYAMMYENPFTSTPVFLADMQTADGGDTANIRCKNKSDSSVDVLIDEEQSKDTEVTHTSEVLGYMAFSR